MPRGEWQKPSYDGLNQQATELWREWLKLYEEQFQDFAYNVRVGRGLDPGPRVSDTMREMWRMVTTKRIDVVGTRLDQTWVIEIEPRPGLRTYGQIHAYLQLLPKYQPCQLTLIGAVISNTMGYDMSQLFRAQGIHYFVFPASGPPRLPPEFPPTFAPAASSPTS